MDLQYPKLPRYQAALYPDVRPSIHANPAASKATRETGSQFCGTAYFPLNSGCATRSPGAIPYFRAVPPITSSTPLAGPPDEMIRVD